jgi:hypothetical protein
MESKRKSTTGFQHKLFKSKEALLKSFISFVKIEAKGIYKVD